MAKSSTDGFARRVRVVSNFPKSGIAFQDLAPLYAAPGELRRIGEALAEAFDGTFDAVLGVEARGFVIGTAVAILRDSPLLLARKPGKLPGRLHTAHYDLEYGTATLTIQQGDLSRGQRVLIVDDVLATGGTLAAAADLIDQAGAEVAGFAVVLELVKLGGSDRLAPRRLESLIKVE